MGAAAVVGIVGGVISLASGLSGYGASSAASKATADSQNARADRIEVNAELARFNAEMNNLQLDKRYNENAANQMVQQGAGAASGRSLTQIRGQDKEDLNWDKRFMSMSGEYSALGYEMDAAELRIAAITGSQIEGAGATTGLLSSTGQTVSNFGGIDWS